MSETTAQDELLADLAEAMRDVVDPELGINVVDLGLVYDLNLEEGDSGTVALIDMTLTSAACPLTDVIEDQSRTALVGAGLVNDIKINWVWNPPWGPDKITDRRRRIHRRRWRLQPAATSAAGLDLLDAVVRMLRLLDHPADVPALAPLIEKEILWRLLTGTHGAMIRQIGLANSALSQVGRAIRWIPDDYTEPMRINDLSRMTGMSPSAFHRHFRAATTLSPLQFQKRVRLQTARSPAAGRTRRCRRRRTSRRLRQPLAIQPRISPPLRRATGP
jgi:metal-sulfur cluster biosynthetic enzyme